MTWRKNDIGGQTAGPIDTADRPFKHWELESDALRKLLNSGPKGLVTLDELRRAMEDLSEEDYESGFFERRLLALVNLLVEKNLITHQEIETRMEELRTT